MNFQSENSRRIAILVCALMVISSIYEGRHVFVALTRMGPVMHPAFSMVDGLTKLFDVVTKVAVPLAAIPVLLLIAWLLFDQIRDWRRNERPLIAFNSRSVVIVGWLILLVSLYGLFTIAFTFIFTRQYIGGVASPIENGTFMKSALNSRWLDALGCFRLAVWIAIGVILVQEGSGSLASPAAEIVALPKTEDVPR